MVAAVCAATWMDNLSSVRNDTGAFVEVVKHSQTWLMALLYIGTFGSFIGYSFAFGLVLQNQFGRTPLQAAAVTFIGPLLGSLIHPVGGRLADRLGGARVTFWNFIAMAVALAVILWASAIDSLGVFTAGFVLLFMLISIGSGNGSTYKMIPALFRGEAEVAIAEGEDAATAFARARRLSGRRSGSSARSARSAACSSTWRSGRRSSPRRRGIRRTGRSWRSTSCARWSRSPTTCGPRPPTRRGSPTREFDITGDAHQCGPDAAAA